MNSVLLFFNSQICLLNSIAFFLRWSLNDAVLFLNRDLKWSPVSPTYVSTPLVGFDTRLIYDVPCLTVSVEWTFLLYLQLHGFLGVDELHLSTDLLCALIFCARLGWL